MDMLPFLSTSVLENDGNEKSHFFISVSKNATEGIFRGYLNIHTPDYHSDDTSGLDLRQAWLILAG
ncbi:MAG: hypothetical protein OXE97_12130 [Gammaproteobacteria bacterium]|nr:hypothetical protein [Gammaproteobacteria bacterium]